ncbi:MAG: adenosylmethionine decarboxylase [Chloroflexi bacterium]|nr:adenosylmethionine decarboxylase [Chloroflexota bacterium]MBI4505321.1 adenosylmethionine decarboxylase [Chloroflexota bacterium]
MHLVIDGFGGSAAKLQDLALIYQTLDELPAKIGMTKIMPPYVFRYHGLKEQDWGISGFVLIAESHISVHTFPERGYVNIDIFSCKAFDAEPAVRAMRETFDLAGVKVHIIERGLEYPTDASALVATDRWSRFGVLAGAQAGTS